MSAADDAIKYLARALAPELAPLLLPLLRAGMTPSADVDLATVQPGKRACYAAARAGAIDGAYKLMRHWYAPRDSYERWRSSVAKRPAFTNGTKQDADDLAELRAKMGLRRIDEPSSGLDALRARMGFRLVGGKVPPAPSAARGKGGV